MITRYLIGAAIVALALSAGCKREEPPKPTTESSPPAAAQPPDKGSSASTTGSATGSAGDAAGDAAVTAKVKTAISASPDVKSLEVNVDTVNGKVTLKGIADSQAQVERVVQITRGTEGVKDVDIQLIVKPKP